MADGYCNARVLKFDSDGTFMSQFGRPSRISLPFSLPFPCEEAERVGCRRGVGGAGDVPGPALADADRGLEHPVRGGPGERADPVLLGGAGPGGAAPPRLRHLHQAGGGARARLRRPLRRPLPHRRHQRPRRGRRVQRGAQAALRCRPRERRLQHLRRRSIPLHFTQSPVFSVRTPTDRQGLENPHCLAVSEDESIYIGEIGPNRVVKVNL